VDKNNLMFKKNISSVFDKKARFYKIQVSVVQIEMFRLVLYAVNK